MFSTPGCIRRLKIIVEYRHIRCKSSKQSYKFRTQKLADILKCNILTAQEITKKNKNIFTLDHPEFERNAEFCMKYLKLSDIVEIPYILSFNSSLLQHRYFSLQELGCSNITASDILKFPHILKQTPKALQGQGYSFCPTFDILNQHLKNSEKNHLNHLKSMYYDGSSLSKIKQAMNAEFLAAKLRCSIGIAQKMLYNYPPLRAQSILNTNLLLNILLQKLGFSVSKVYSSVSLLSLHPEIVEQFLTDIPEILGIDTAHIARRIPLVLRRPISSIQKVEAILKEFCITEAQLMCCPKIIVFTPNTVQQRLKILCNSEDFSVLKSYKKFLWLVYYYNNVNPRLEALKTFDIPCSISMFTVSKANFNKYLCVSECRTHINDVCFYLAEFFHIEEKEILMKLREYPSYQNASLMNCRHIIEFLLKAGVTKKQIFNGIGIICYDVDVVKVYFEDLKKHPGCQPFEEWIPHYNLIQLLIYAIEVDSGFRGRGKYKSKIDEPEELLAGYSIN